MKKYITPSRPSYLTGIALKDKRIYIDFVSKPTGNIRVGTYTTSNNDIIAALEADDRFGKTWFLLEETVVEQQAEPIDTTIKIPADVVAGFQQARKYLITRFGYTATEVSNMDEVIKISKSRNLEFTGWTPKSTKTQ